MSKEISAARLDLCKSLRVCGDGFSVLHEKPLRAPRPIMQIMPTGKRNVCIHRWVEIEAVRTSAAAQRCCAIATRSCSKNVYVCIQILNSSRCTLENNSRLREKFCIDGVNRLRLRHSCTQIRNYSPVSVFMSRAHDRERARRKCERNLREKDLDFAREKNREMYGATPPSHKLFRGLQFT